MQTRSQRRATTAAVVAPRLNLLDIDEILPLLMDALGAVAFLKASPCRAWFNAAQLPADHDLWKAACFAESPLLAQRHSVLSTWKALLIQRKKSHQILKLNTQPQSLPTNLRMALELTDADSGPVIFAREEAMADPELIDEDIHTFKIEHDIWLTWKQLNGLRLNLYLIDGSRTCCLAANLQHDDEGWESWFIPELLGCRLNVKPRFDEDRAYEATNDGGSHERQIMPMVQVDVAVHADEGGSSFKDLLRNLSCQASSWTSALQ